MSGLHAVRKPAAPHVMTQAFASDVTPPDYRAPAIPELLLPCPANCLILSANFMFFSDRKSLRIKDLRL